MHNLISIWEKYCCNVWCSPAFPAGNTSIFRINFIKFHILSTADTAVIELEKWIKRQSNDMPIKGMGYASHNRKLYKNATAASLCVRDFTLHSSHLIWTYFPQVCGRSMWTVRRGRRRCQQTWDLTSGTARSDWMEQSGEEKMSLNIGGSFPLPPPPGNVVCTRFLFSMFIPSTITIVSESPHLLNAH